MRDRVRLGGGRRGKAAGRKPSLAMRVGGWLMVLVWQSPKDALAMLLAFAAVVAILTNALLLQTGRHPSPLFGTVSAPPAEPVAAVNPLPRARPLEAERKAAPVDVEKKAEPSSRMAARSLPATPAPQAAAVRPPAAVPQPKSDPLGDLIVSSRRLVAVQRVLVEYGYGQFKAMGVMNVETQAAIERFERERRMPVTGQVSDRLVRELALVTGRSID
ncbi:MAG: peptidoglycan-binding protein [Xanthobacteraceae bacterium]|nr:MAG: peptidoglycan-binding protein [Xanthobacteraceae bacterium]